jgi:DNA polymerase
MSRHGRHLFTSESVTEGHPDKIADQIREHLRLFGELGVAGTSRDPAWRRRAAAQASEPPVAQTSEPPVAQAFRPASLEPDPPVLQVARSADDVLRAIKTDIGDDCSRCKLQRLGRKQIVFGVGNPDADLMFVGEAPGADEDAQGIPFVGRAGQLLTKMIAAMGFDRDQVYIANVIKCRPPQNRPPEPDEIASCEPFLFRQIDAIAPKVIVALGSFAAKTLLATDQSISRLRGKVYDFRGVKLVPTFHPSYLLRSPDRKREAWEDLKTARALLGASPD